MANQRKLSARFWRQWLPMVLTTVALLLSGARAGGQQPNFLIPLASADVSPTPQTPGQTEGAERLHLLVGRSLVISSPTRIKRISIADPNVADAVIISPLQILVSGKAPGGVSLVLWNEANQSQTFELFVDLDILGLSQKIREVFPQEPVRVEASKDLVMLSGRVSSKAVADKIVQVVSAVNPKVVSLMEIPPAPRPDQILLEVKFAEVNRGALNQFGFNVFSVPGSTTRTLALTGTQQFGPGTLQNLQTDGKGNLQNVTLSFSDLLNLFIFRPDINLGAAIKALQNKNVLQILAEPNLLTQSGKEANFLAGGEFPYPVLQGGGAGTLPTVTIQFREFGVRLRFTPEITEGGKIHLNVKPEVSSLDFANGLQFQGTLIPALSTRRVEADVELDDGQSFAIAGLVDDRVTQVLNKIPALGDIPILGQLFRSRQTNKTKTELLVLVTPHRVKPYEAGQAPAGPQFPVQFLTVPSTPAPGTPKPAPPK